MTTTEIIQAYYAAFNSNDTDAMAGMLTDDVAHDVNQGARRVGVEAFREFCAHMDECYSEKLTDIVVMVDKTGNRAAAEFTVLGAYIGTDEGLPEADNQKYTLPAGTFFDLRDGKIARIATCYNLQDWLRQVGAEGS